MSLAATTAGDCELHLSVSALLSAYGGISTLLLVTEVEQPLIWLAAATGAIVGKELGLTAVSLMPGSLSSSASLSLLTALLSIVRVVVLEVPVFLSSSSGSVLERQLSAILVCNKNNSKLSLICMGWRGRGREGGLYTEGGGEGGSSIQSLIKQDVLKVNAETDFREISPWRLQTL